MVYNGNKREATEVVLSESDNVECNSLQLTMLNHFRTECLAVVYWMCKRKPRTLLHHKLLWVCSVITRTKNTIAYIPLFGMSHQTLSHWNSTSQQKTMKPTIQFQWFWTSSWWSNFIALLQKFAFAIFKRKVTPTQFSQFILCRCDGVQGDATLSSSPNKNCVYYY